MNQAHRRRPLARRRRPWTPLRRRQELRRCRAFRRPHAPRSRAEHRRPGPRPAVLRPTPLAAFRSASARRQRRLHRSRSQVPQERRAAQDRRPVRRQPSPLLRRRRPSRPSRAGCRALPHRRRPQRPTHRLRPLLRRPRVRVPARHSRRLCRMPLRVRRRLPLNQRQPPPNSRRHPAPARGVVRHRVAPLQSPSALSRQPRNRVCQVSFR